MWDSEFEGDPNNIEVYLRPLRHKAGLTAGFATDYVLVVAGGDAATSPVWATTPGRGLLALRGES